MRTILFSAFAILLAACAATPAKRIEAAPEAFAKLPPEQQARVKAGEVGVGFDQAATRLALGNPDRITERETSEGKQQIWLYYDYQGGVAPGFCPGYINGFYGYPGFHGHRGYFYEPAFCYYDNTVAEERMRVAFKDGLVTSVDRTLR